MKGTKIKYLVIIPIGLLFIFLIIGMILQIRDRYISNQYIQSLTSFCLPNNDGKKFCIESLPEQPIIIFYFQPECEICLEEIMQIKSLANEFKEVTVLLITNVELNRSDEFKSTLFNLHILIDKNQEFKEYARISMVPTILIYDKKKRLINKFIGEVKVDALVKYIKQ